MLKRKIMISAYACEPNKGSEPGVGWNWVLQMSKYYELWVLTRKSNEPDIQKFIEQNEEYKCIHFIYFDFPKWARFWKKGMRGVRTYYTLWQLCSNRIIRNTMEKNEIEIFHHLTYGNSLWTVSKYGQKKFFVYGPVGGVDTIPKDFSKNYSFRNRTIELIRRIVVAMLPLNIGFKRRCKNADVILCKTKYMQNAVPKQYRDKAIIFTDVAVELQQMEKMQSTDNDKIEFLIVGKFDAWRGIDLAIEAITKLSKERDDIHLTIIGDGSDRSRLEKMVSKRNIDRFVTFTGTVDYQTYHNYIANCDVVLNPALKEGAVTVAFDAMSYGKPIVCVNTYGYTNYFQDIAAMVERTNYVKTIDALTTEMRKLFDKDVRDSMGNKLQQRGLEYTWDAKGIQIYNMLEKYISRVE